jgi:hypothetical protein
MSRKKRPAVLRTYVSEPLRVEVERAADEEGRSTSDLLRHLLVAWVAQRVSERAQAGA